MRAAYTSGTLVPIHPHAGLPLSVLTGDGGSLSYGAFCPFLYTRPSNNEARKERGTREKRQRGVLHFGTFLPSSTFSRTVGPSLPRVPLPPDRRYTFHGHCSRVENRLRIGRSRCVAVDANARARALHRAPPLHTHRVYIAVRSDDRNDSNHRLTSGIRHSGFRVATPAAIVAVYDCRARSPSLFTDMFFFLQLLHFSSPLFRPLRLALAPARANPASSSLRISTLLALSLSLAISRTVSPSLYLAILRISLTRSSRISFLFPLSRSLARSPSSFTRSRSLPTSRWSALDPTRYRPHSRAQTTRQRYTYMHSRVHRSPPPPLLPSPLQSRSVARTIALLRGPEKS